ncbi:MAG: PIG-L family deacetylase [Candidatus Melainabacteria bacterium]|nr:PIG-L family deacetylase [Candidatus Melainabacteria bacterium]MBX9673189.1 PIG-L family deacetylase [Candidatus Obscuribacterales bacterium]
MPPTQSSKQDMRPLLVFGAHPDDIEFGCGAIVIAEALAGRPVHLVVCSRGETASHGSPDERLSESRKAAEIMRVDLDFVELDGDAHLETSVSHTIKLARLIRSIKPSTILATTTVKNQHPDHARLGEIVRDAARLARYGGLKELIDQPAHAIEQLFFYAVTPDGEPRDVTPIYIDISAPEVVSTWQAAMQAHVTQVTSRNYIDLQMSRARLLGTRAGIEYAMAVYPNEPMVIDKLAQAGKGARRF